MLEVTENDREKLCLLLGVEISQAKVKPEPVKPGHSGAQDARQTRRAEILVVSLAHALASDPGENFRAFPGAESANRGSPCTPDQNPRPTLAIQPLERARIHL